jgi:hypothetical protein
MPLVLSFPERNAEARTGQERAHQSSSDHRRKRENERQHSSSAEKVKSHCPRTRLVIALHSPSGFVETGLHVQPPEKMAAKPAWRNQRDTFSSPVSDENRRIAAFPSDFGGNVAWFLDTPDWVAERDGFELPVQLWQLGLRGYVSVAYGDSISRVHAPEKANCLVRRVK